MPDLKCTVQTCVHNYKFLCDLDKFQERKEGSYMNAAVSDRSPSDLCSVDCKATECMYNEDCQCHAGKISVEGSDACHCEGTECATFQCR